MSILNTDADLDSDLTKVEPGDDIEIVQVGNDEPDWLDAGLTESPADALRRSQGEDDVAGDAANASDEIKPEIQARIDAAERGRSAAERAAREQEDRFEQQILAAEKAKSAVQRDSFKIAIDSLDVRRAQAEQALAAAEEAGDAAEKIRMNRLVRDIEKEQDRLSHLASQVPSDAALDAQYDQYRRTKPQRRETSAGSDEPLRALNPKANTWMSQNGWMRDAKYRAELAYLQEVNNDLAAKGRDPNSDEFFTELSRTMAKRFPDLPIRMLDGRGVGNATQTQRAPGRQSPPVASARSAVTTQTARSAKPRANITPNDRAFMVRMGLDPSNEKHMKYFARERIARLAREQQEGRR